MAENLSSPDIAIVGMSGRFPGAADVREFWKVITAGKECIRTFTDEELTAAGVRQDLLADPRYVRRGAPLESVELFDADFFNMSPSEARTTDPQQRLFLECAWAALESAGHAQALAGGMVGVFGSCSFNTYLIANLCRNRNVAQSTNPYQVLIGNDKDHLCTRVSYKFDLKGPSITVQSACSSSLVAVHLACQSLLSGECDLALAGGASVKFPQREGYLYLDGGILSRDGQCRPLDHRASGTIKGDAVAVVVLRRLEDALRDNDAIIAVIKGSGVGNDGAARIGYTAPSAAGQADLISEVLEVAGLCPEDVDYHELHGTATAIGDVIEFQALQKVFGAQARPRPCVLGGLKANMGHLDVAAGVTGLIKTALCLREDVLPPQIHFERPNPQIDLQRSPFRVNRTLQTSAGLDHASVSSFGLGGTSAYVLLEKAPECVAAGPGLPAYLVPVSARSEAALRQACADLYAHASGQPINLANVSFTLGAGRRHFEHRFFAVCRDRDDFLRQMQAGAGGDRLRTIADLNCAFVFSGSGATASRYDGLAAHFPSFDRGGASGAGPQEVAAWLGKLGIQADVVCGWEDGDEDQLAARLADANVVFRIGPDDDRTRSLRRRLPGTEGEQARAWVCIEPAAGEPAREVACVLEALGTAWAAGLPVNFEELFAGIPRQRDPFLPTYPFERKPYWVEPDADAVKVKAPESAGPATDANRGPLPADVEARVMASWQKKLGVDALDADSDFSELGGASLDALEISAELEQAFHVPLPRTLAFTTPRELARQIVALLRDKALPPVFDARCLVPIKSGPASPPLVLVHPAGGTVSCYHGLARNLPKDLSLFGIQAGEDQGAADASPPSLADVAAAYAEELAPLLGKGSLLLGGYSFGGNVAFEMATRLRRRGTPLADLVLFDSHPPHAYRSVTSNEANFLRAFPLIVRVLFGTGNTGESLSPAYGECRDAASVIRQMHQDGILPRFLDEATALRFYRTWRHNFDALRGHRPQDKFQGNVILFRGREQESPEVLDLLGMRPVAKEEWSEYLDGSLEIIDVPGDHYTMFSNKLHLQSLGEALARRLRTHPALAAGLSAEVP